MQVEKSLCIQSLCVVRTDDKTSKDKAQLFIIKHKNMVKCKVTFRINICYCINVRFILM